MHINGYWCLVEVRNQKKNRRKLKMALRITGLMLYLYLEINYMNSQMFVRKMNNYM